MATPHRGNDEGKGTAEEAGQADGSNNVAEDGSEYEYAHLTKFSSTPADTY